MPIPERLDHYRRDTHGLALITLVGAIDLDSAPLLREVLEHCLHDDMNTIDVDLTRVTFCDCHGLGILLDASRQATAAGGALRLRHPSAAMARLLSLTGTESVLLGRAVDAVTSAVMNTLTSAVANTLTSAVAHSKDPLPPRHRKAEPGPAATVRALTAGVR